MSRASAAPTASITSPSLLQPEEYPLQPVMDRMPRFEHDLFGTAGAAVEVAPRVMGAIGERLTAGATNIHKLFVNGFSNIKSSSFWSKVKPAIVTFDAAAPTSEATSLSTTTPIFDILEASGEVRDSVWLALQQRRKGSRGFGTRPDSRPCFHNNYMEHVCATCICCAVISYVAAAALRYPSDGG